MNHPPLAILLSSTSIRDGESALLTEMFEVGLKRLHLRKPDEKSVNIAKLIGSIPEVHHPKIVIHRFPELLKDFNLAGYHHHAREKLIDCQGTKSRSLHSLDELKEIQEPLDYCLFGPVYESISKKGYLPKVSLPELGSVLFGLQKSSSNSPSVYALGGVRRRKVPELFNLGFDGVCLLGSVWGKKDPVAAFEKYQFLERSVWAKKEKRKGLLRRILEKETN